MALFGNFSGTDLLCFSRSFRTSSSLFVSPNFNRFSLLSFKKISYSSALFVRSLTNSDGNKVGDDNNMSDKSEKKRLSKQSSWEAKDLEGNDYLYRLGKEADNMNVTVGARAGVIDDLFAGNFLGRDC